MGGTAYQDIATDDQVVVGTRLTGSDETPDVLFFVAEDRPAPSLLGPRTSIFFVGNDTPVSDLPPGSARYTGVAFGVNSAAQTAAGEITLDVGFRTNTLGGSLSGVNPADRDAVYAIANGSENDGALTAELTGAGVIGGTLTGAIYGPDADQAAGTFLVSIPGETFIGAYAATD